MEKNWLIRTKSNHILGPVSKEKVVELYHNGSLKPSDEICSGNGYWFFIREEELVNRFLLGNERQGFNPLSEAKDILTSKETPAPAEAQPHTDITLVGNIDLKALKEQEQSPPDQTPSSQPKAVESATDKSLHKDDKKKIT